MASSGRNFLSLYSVWNPEVSTEDRCAVSVWFSCTKMFQSLYIQSYQLLVNSLTYGRVVSKIQSLDPQFNTIIWLDKKQNLWLIKILVLMNDKKSYKIRPKQSIRIKKCSSMFLIYHLYSLWHIHWPFLCILTVVESTYISTIIHNSFVKGSSICNFCVYNALKPSQNVTLPTF